MRVFRPVLIAAAASFITVTLSATVPSAAFAGEKGLINANGVDVHIAPSKRAKSVIKLYLGRPVQVVDVQDGWVKIAFDVERGVDRIAMDGWLKRDYVRSRSRFGFSFERTEQPAGTPRQTSNDDAFADAYEDAYTAEDGGYNWEQPVSSDYEAEPTDDVLAELSAEWEAAADEEADDPDWTFDSSDDSEDSSNDALPWE